MIRPCIMVHVPKTGGTSVWKCIESMGIEFQNLGYCLRPTCKLSVPFVNLEHLSVEHLISTGVFTREWYESRFRFSFVRNPWDRLVSLFEYLQYRLTQKRQRESNQYLESFDVFVHKLIEKDCPYVKPLGRLATDDWSQANPQVRWTEQGVDFIGRYEYLDWDWYRLCQTIGLPHKRLSVHRKSKRRLPRYQDYYTNELAELVGSHYHEDVEKFGYSYD